MNVLDNKTIWKNKNKSIEIDIKNILDISIRISTVTDVLGRVRPITLWGKDGQDFLEFYKKNK